MTDAEFSPMNQPDPSRDEKNLAVLAHLLPLFGVMVPGLNLAVPLGIWLWKTRLIVVCRTSRQRVFEFPHYTHVAGGDLGGVAIHAGGLAVVTVGACVFCFGAGVYGVGSYEGRQW